MRSLDRRAWLTLRVMLNYNRQRMKLNILPAENWMTLRLIHDCKLERKVTAKRLLAEVSPWLCSEATALRTLHAMERQGKIRTERDPKDRRSLIVHPDDALVESVNKLMIRASQIASR